MGSRILLPVIAVGLIVAGLFLWKSTGNGASTTVAPSVAAPMDEGPLRDSTELDSPELARTAQTKRKDVASHAPKKTATEVKAKVDDGSRVVGRVVDRFGNPVAGAQVDLNSYRRFNLDRSDTEATETGSATSGSDGRFLLEVKQAGTHRLTVLASGYAPLAPKQIRLSGIGEKDLGELILSRGAILSGHVYDSFGSPVAGASIYDNQPEAGDLIFGLSGARFNRGGLLATSAEDGSFRIESLACGAWSFSVESDEHPILSVEGVADVPGKEVGGLAFQFAATGSISGRILGLPKDGHEQLSVRARPSARRGDMLFGADPAETRQVDCDADGSFDLRGLKANEDYDLQARIPRGNRIGIGMLGGGFRSDVTRARAGDSGVELFYSRGASIRFQVVDARSNEPVTELLVSSGRRFLMPLRDDDGRIKRDFPGGAVEIPGIYPRGNKQTVDLEISATGYHEQSFEKLEFLPGDDLDLGVIRLNPAPVLVVSVTDAKSGVPVTGATVSLSPAPKRVDQVEGRFEMEMSFGEDDSDRGTFFGNQRRAETDEFGVAILNSLEGIDCVLRVGSDGHAPFELNPLYLPEGERVERDVALNQGGSVEVSVYDATGQPLADVKVEHRAPGANLNLMRFGGGSRSRDRTNVDGLANFIHLAAGVHAFRVQESGGGGAGGFMSGGGEAVIMMGGGGGVGDESAWVEIEVAEGSSGSLRLDAKPSGILEGKILEGGLALAGAELKLSKTRERDGGGMPDMAAIFGGGGPSTRTDGDGYYIFEDVKPGEYTLEISHPTRVLVANRDLELRERGGEVHERFDVDLSISIIEGRIVDQNGDPVAGVEVHAEREVADQAVVMQFIMVNEDDDGSSVSFGDDVVDGRIRTDADGNYSLRGVPANEKLVIVAAGAFFEETQSEPVTVVENGVRSGVDLVLPMAGKLQVYVVDAEGNPAGMCMLIAEYQGSQEVDPSREIVGPSGKARLSGLRPGSWKISIQALGNGTEEPVDTGELIEVVAGETATLTVDAP